MKINVTLSISEKSYIKRTIAKVAPSYDQTNLWTDMESKFPAFSSAQITDQSGNVEAILDINPEFVMDVTDVCGEVIEKAKGFAFMLKGAWEGIKQYGKELAQRFDRWIPEMSSEAVYKEAESSAMNYIEHSKNLGDDEFICVIVNTDKEHLGEEGRVASHTYSDLSFADLVERGKKYSKKLGSKPAFYYFYVDQGKPMVIDTESMEDKLTTAKKAADAYIATNDMGTREYVVVVNDAAHSTCHGYDIQKLLHEYAGTVVIYKNIDGKAVYAKSAVNPKVYSAGYNMVDRSTVDKAREYLNSNLTDEMEGNFVAVVSIGDNDILIDEKFIGITEKLESLPTIPANKAFIFMVLHGVPTFISSIDIGEEDK